MLFNLLQHSSYLFPLRFFLGWVWGAHEDGTCQSEGAAKKATMTASLGRSKALVSGVWEGIVAKREVHFSIGKPLFHSS